jgi:VanZ family protein
MMLIFVLSSVPSLPAFRAPFDVPTIAHIVFFGILCLLAERAFFHQTALQFLRTNSLLSAFVFTCAYGVLDEVHQLYVPGRWADVYDVVADAIGATIAMAWLRLRLGGFRRPLGEKGPLRV